MKKAEAMKRFYESLRLLRRSRSTVKTYTAWVGQYIDFISSPHAGSTREERIGKFLSRLVIKGNVSATTQKQALCAIIAFYKLVLREDVGELTFTRSSRPKFLPAVFSREEAWAVLDRLDGVGWLWGALMYGCGLRLEECCGLRVQDVDIDRMQVNVRRGKGSKDRIVPLPAMLVDPLQKHLRRIRVEHEGYARRRVPVSLPDALDRKYPQAPYSWEWFWLFPASGPALDPRWGNRLYHIHHSAVQKRIGRAIRAAAIPKKAGCHTLRHSFATHWLEGAEGSHEAALLRLQRLMGHTDPKTTMIYLHLLKPRTDVPSPLDARPPVEVKRAA
jgi:integron integrase